MTGLPGVFLLLVGIGFWLAVTFLLFRHEIRRERRRPRPLRAIRSVADEAEEWLQRR